MFESWLRAYEWTLDWVLARKALMLVVTLATLGGTVYALHRSCRRASFRRRTPAS